MQIGVVLDTIPKGAFMLTAGELFCWKPYFIRHKMYPLKRFYSFSISLSKSYVSKILIKYVFIQNESLLKNNQVSMSPLK